MRTCNAFFFSRKEQTAQWLWSRHVKSKLCRRIQSSSTSNSMCLGKLCLKLARKQSFPSTKNGLQGMLRLLLLPGWRYDLWKQAAQALLLKRRCGKGAWDWKDGWWVTHTHTPLMSRLCFPTVKWKHQRKHPFFGWHLFQRLQKKIHNPLQWGLVDQLRLLIISSIHRYETYRLAGCVCQELAYVNATRLLEFKDSGLVSCWNKEKHDKKNVCYIDLNWWHGWLCDQGSENQQRTSSTCSICTELVGLSFGSMCLERVRWLA